MQELLLVNPSPRRNKRRKNPAHRSAAQRAATRKMLAANRARRGTKKRHTAKRHHARAAVYAANPAPRRHKPRSYARNPIHHVRRHRKHYRRNPIGSVGGIGNLLMQSFQGAAGGVLVNTAFNYIPLPASLSTGNLRYIAKGALAILLGVAGRKVMPAKLATNMAVGSLTITMHEAITGFAATMLPSVKLGGIGYYTGGYPASAIPMSRSAPAPQTRGMAEYVRSGGMGEVGMAF